MLSKIHHHARDNLVGYLALFVALSGTAVAASGELARNSVGTAQLRRGAVTGRKVARHTLTGANIKSATLGTVPNATRVGGLPPSALQSRVAGTCQSGTAISEIDPGGTVTCQPTGTGTVTGVSPGAGLTGGGSNGNVSLSIAGSGVGTTQLADGAVTNAKLANSSLTVNAGAGLTAGGSVALGGSGTLSVNPASVQSRVTGTCASQETIASISQSGGVSCLRAGAQDGGSVTADSSSVQFDPDGLVGWQSITRVATGQYCLTPSAGTSPTSPLLLSVGTGAQPGGLAFVAQAGLCSVSPVAFAVDTWNGVSDAPSNFVAFTAVVP